MFESVLTLEQTHGRTSPFALSKPPFISLAGYIHRLYSCMHCSVECFVLARIYLDRISTKYPITAYSVHRSVLLSVVVAAKYHDDRYYTNAHYAKVGGISVETLNELEARFLQCIEYQLWVEEDVYEVFAGCIR